MQGQDTLESEHRMLAISDGVMVAIVAVVALVCGGAGYGLAAYLATKKARATQGEADGILERARRDAETLRKEASVEAKEAAIKARETFEKETAQTKEELRDRERTLAKREDTIESKMETLARKEKTVEASEKRVSDQEQSLTGRQKEVEGLVAEQKQQLHRISGLQPGEARALLLGKMEAEVQHEAAALIQRITDQAHEDADQKAREVLAIAIQRLASDYTSEATVATVDIPSDEMKGRIIGARVATSGRSSGRRGWT